MDELDDDLADVPLFQALKAEGALERLIAEQRQKEPLGVALARQGVELAEVIPLFHFRAVLVLPTESGADILDITDPIQERKAN